MHRSTRKRYLKIYREYEQLSAQGYRYAIITERLANKWCFSTSTIEKAIQWGRRQES